ncbi:MAG: hypothetical protein M3R48_01045 [Candidatus Dormibacteraeota bacterium]|nr:hypothetical protein [Candidatus Dormibacteraeota bacterium]
MVRGTLAVTLMVSAGLVAACGSSTTTTTPTPTVGTPVIATPTPTVSTPPPTSAAAASVDLSGNWSGQYSGPFNGTFTLTWTQTGTALDGTINLSSPNQALHINGTVTGSSIGFGAVGVVTYTGTVSGSSMSGSYKDVANGGTGSWSANKTS